MTVAHGAPAKRIMETPANLSLLTGASEEVNTNTKPLTWYKGLDAIGKYMGWSTMTVMRYNQKQNFPLIRIPQQRGQHWTYATNDALIALWFDAKSREAYEHVARTAFGRKLRATRGAPPPTTGTEPAQPPDPPPAHSDSTIQPLDIATNLNNV